MLPDAHLSCPCHTQPLQQLLKTAFIAFYPWQIKIHISEEKKTKLLSRRKPFWSTGDTIIDAAFSRRRWKMDLIHFLYQVYFQSSISLHFWIIYQIKSIQQATDTSPAELLLTFYSK